MSAPRSADREAAKLHPQDIAISIEPKTGNDGLNSLIKQYLAFEKIQSHKEAIEKLVINNDISQLERLIGKRLTFGTAGLRGSMGPGFGQMNDLVIIQTSQGLASYLLELKGNSAIEQGVIIGNDARYNSSRFARLAALAFLQKGIPVYFCDHIIPTPLIAFGVKHFKCCAGIVVTASHNPKNDNGYKVYFSNGAQILSPHDKAIQDHIIKPSNQNPWSRAWESELLSASDPSQVPNEWQNIFFRIHGDLCKNYFAYIETLAGFRRYQNQSSNQCITYTTMHGVGHIYLSRALDIAGFEDVFPVEAQKKPDPDFSTVKFPNPEEAGALDLAFETAQHANSNLILATDPDADRCAAAIYDPKRNYKRVFTGNEIGALLGWWIWHCFKEQNQHGIVSANDYGFTDSQADDKERLQTQESGGSSDSGSKTKRVLRKPEDCYMISTAVSSKFLQSMARIEGFQFVETLTGFKYMGNLADELIKEHDKSVLFAYEEAIGYMVDSTILDKDGISAAVQMAQCAAFVSLTYQRTLEEHLDWLYTIYGYHYSLNSYYICSDPKIIGEIFKNLQANYPKNFGDNFEVKRVRDLNNGYDNGLPNNKASLPCSSSSFMITFFVNDNISFTIRTSGTEPKIKYYSEIVAKLPPFKSTKHIETNDFNDPIQSAAKNEARVKLQQLVQVAVEVCLKPSHYELEAAD